MLQLLELALRWHDNGLGTEMAFIRGGQLPDRTGWVTLSEPISPVGKRLAQSSLNLDAHVIRSMLFG